MKYVDMHTHSTASDGTYTPSELAKYASETGLSAVALTDHDTIDGVDEFMRACEKYGITGVPGVELSAKYRKEMHILGLFVDYKNEEFITRTQKLRQARTQRNKALLELLQKDGFDIREEDIVGQKAGGSLDNCGRAHIARAMVKKGYADSVQDAFDKYLNRGMPYYIPRSTLPPEETIALIKSAGGIAVLAHPIFITTDPPRLEQLFDELKSYGLDGVECHYSEYTKGYSDLCCMLAKKAGLEASGGSDFHGANKEHIRLGRCENGNMIDYEIYKNLKKRCDEQRK